MRNGCLTVMSALAVVVGLALAPAMVASQAPAESNLTPWGEPNLEGIWYAFENVPLERPDEYAGRESLTDEEFAAIASRKSWIERVAEGAAAAEEVGRDRRQESGTQEDVSGAYNAVWTPGRDHLRPSRRTSLIVDPPDGKIPALTSEAQARVAAVEEFQQALLQGTPMGEPGPISPRRSEAAPSYNLRRLYRPTRGPEDRARTERCLPLMLPAFGGRIYHRIVQSPGYVAIYYEPSGHSGANRVIPIGDRHVPLPSHVRQWLGDPRGRWEGNTLVVETTNFTRKTDYHGSRENLHLTERFTRLDAETVQYEVTVEDPTTWTRPWTIRADMTKQSDYENRLYEPSCHEGNYGLVGILSGARSDERAFAEGRGTDPETRYNLYFGVPGISGAP